MRSIPLWLQLVVPTAQAQEPDPDPDADLTVGRGNNASALPAESSDDASSHSYLAGAVDSSRDTSPPKSQAPSAPSRSSGSTRSSGWSDSSQTVDNYRGEDGQFSVSSSSGQDAFDSSDTLRKAHELTRANSRDYNVPPAIDNPDGLTVEQMMQDRNIDFQDDASTKKWDISPNGKVPKEYNFLRLNKNKWEVKDPSKLTFDVLHDFAASRYSGWDQWSSKRKDLFWSTAMEVDANGRVGRSSLETLQWIHDNSISPQQMAALASSGALSRGMMSSEKLLQKSAPHLVDGSESILKALSTTGSTAPKTKKEIREKIKALDIDPNSEDGFKLAHSIYEQGVSAEDFLGVLKRANGDEKSAIEATNAKLRDKDENTSRVTNGEALIQQRAARVSEDKAQIQSVMDEHATESDQGHQILTHLPDDDNKDALLSLNLSEELESSIETAHDVLELDIDPKKKDAIRFYLASQIDEADLTTEQKQDLKEQLGEIPEYEGDIATNATTLAQKLIASDGQDLDFDKDFSAAKTAAQSYLSSESRPETVKTPVAFRLQQEIIGRQLDIESQLEDILPFDLEPTKKGELKIKDKDRKDLKPEKLKTIDALLTEYNTLTTDYKDLEKTGQHQAKTIQVREMAEQLETDNRDWHKAIDEMDAGKIKKLAPGEKPDMTQLGEDLWVQNTAAGKAARFSESAGKLIEKSTKPLQALKTTSDLIGSLKNLRSKEDNTVKDMNEFFKTMQEARKSLRESMTKSDQNSIKQKILNRIFGDKNKENSHANKLAKASEYKSAGERQKARYVKPDERGSLVGANTADQKAKAQAKKAEGDAKKSEEDANTQYLRNMRQRNRMV